jgi:hypothetical protein
MTKFRYTHSRVIDNKRHVWNVERLWATSAGLPVTEVLLTSIAEVEQDCWFETRVPTIRAVSAHCRRIMDADLAQPIILHSDGALMDGGHRIARALLEGRTSLPAVRFTIGPEPDVIDELEPEAARRDQTSIGEKQSSREKEAL